MPSKKQEVCRASLSSRRLGSERGKNGKKSFHSCFLGGREGIVLKGPVAGILQRSDRIEPRLPSAFWFGFHATVCSKSRKFCSFFQPKSKYWRLC